MIYKEAFDAVSFPYSLTLVAFEPRALQLSLSGHPPVPACILSLPGSALCGPQPPLLQVESPFSEIGCDEFLSWGHRSSGGVPHVYRVTFSAQHRQILCELSFSHD